MVHCDYCQTSLNMSTKWWEIALTNCTQGLPQTNISSWLARLPDRVTNMQPANLAFAHARLRASNVSIRLSFSRDRFTSSHYTGSLCLPCGSLRKPNNDEWSLRTVVGATQWHEYIHRPRSTKEYRTVVVLAQGQDNKGSNWFHDETTNNTCFISLLVTGWPWCADCLWHPLQRIEKCVTDITHQVWEIITLTRFREVSEVSPKFLKSMIVAQECDVEVWACWTIYTNHSQMIENVDLVQNLTKIDGNNDCVIPHDYRPLMLTLHTPNHCSRRS